MLEQEPYSQDPNSQEHSAGQVRVKKDEFARAIAALEARRQAQAQELEGTVVIGDVLQQLQINIPADEVLQEIEAIHGGQPREQAPRRPLWTAEQAATARLAAGMALVPIGAVAIAALILNPVKQTVSARPPGMMGANRDLPLFLPPPPSNPTGASGAVMDEGGFNASSVLKPLSSVPDNQPVHCTTASFNQLTASYRQTASYSQSLRQPYNLHKPPGCLDPAVLAQSSQLFDVRPNLKKPWTLIKHNGKLYLRGWVAGKFTAAQAEGQIVTLHGTQQSFELGVQPVPITLPVNFVQYGFNSNSGHNEPGITAGSISLDSHAWEKW